jgi:hypothetical protein
MISNKSTKNNNNNFIVLRLFDSDFGSQLISAISEMPDFALNESARSVTLKRAIVQHIVGSTISQDAHSARDSSVDWKRYQHIEEYLNKNLTIECTEKKPIENHEGGSAYFDVNLKQSFSY